MPVISATAFPAIPAVRVNIDWADSGQAAYATVWRVDCETGVRTMLRPYISYNADGFLALSCGVATFWDTEMPMDRCFYYCTTAETSAGAQISSAPANLITDTFTRVTASGWGTADTGQVWLIISGTASHFSTTGTRGQMSLTAVASVHRIQINGTVLDSDDMITFYPTVVATGSFIEAALLARRDDTANSEYRATLQFGTAGTVVLVVSKIVAGVSTTLSTSAALGTYTAASGWKLRLSVQGNMIQAKAWDATSPEPDTFQAIVSDSSVLNSGYRQVRYNLNTGNTNTLPVNAQADDYTSRAPCAADVTVEACTGTFSMPSSGDNFLRDPLNPCNDLRIGLCYVPDPACVPGRGVFFARLDPEIYPSNGDLLNPVNARRPVPVTRERGDAQSRLVLITRTFADRDALLAIAQPGTVLLWSSPPEYGIPDRYIFVADEPVTRTNDDHRIQPRVIELPFTTTDAPVGPAHGVCGTRIDDLCDVYSSWQGMVTAGLSYQDLLGGFGSNDIPAQCRRTWGTVKTTYASFLAMETAPNTWATLRDC